MELGRAFSYIFEDKKWVSKLLPLLLVGILSLIPVFGLIAAALGLGYLVHLAKNVREGLPRPLPDWTKWQDKLKLGGEVLVAVILYNLPSVLAGACSYTLIAGLTSGFLGSAVSFVAFCCTAPILIVYSFFAWSMLAVGVAEVIETGDSARLYRIGHQWDALRVHNRLIFQWVFYALLVNLVSGLLALIPCIGWIAFFLFAYPVQGHLFGQFVHRLSVANKPERESRIRASD